MRNVSWRSRARQLTDPVWLGRTVDGYANLIAARLRKLAGEGSTGMLPMSGHVSGHGEGAVFFRDGQVIYAESARTPMLLTRAAGLGLTHEEPREPFSRNYAGKAELVVAPSVSRIASMLTQAEPTIDATTELVSSDYRFAKFRPGCGPPVVHVRRIHVEALLAEVQRRRAVLRQLAAVITPDTMITRKPSLDAPSAQVSRAQWAVLVRAGRETTPRDVAMQLGQSVFGTTIEAHRLITLGLLVAPVRQRPPNGGPATQAPAPQAQAAHAPASQSSASQSSATQAQAAHAPALAMSFMRAVCG